MFRRREIRREEVRHMERRRMRRRVVVGGAVLIGGSAAMVKMSAADAQAIQDATGTAPEDMSHEELQQAAQQQGISLQPATEEDQRTMAAAEAAEPGEDAAPAAPERDTVVAPPPPPAAAGRDVTGELEQLAALHASGALTDAEFAAAKRDVLGGA